MFDEYIRAWNGWNAHLAYVEESREEALEQGLQQGREEGIEQGRAQERAGTINMIADLVKGGHLTKGIGASKLNLSEQEFEKYL